MRLSQTLDIMSSYIYRVAEPYSATLRAESALLYADGVYTHPSHSATVRGTSVPHRGTLWAASALVQGALCSACDTRMCLPHPDTGAGRAFRHVWAAGFALYLRQAHLSSPPRHEVRGGAVRASLCHEHLCHATGARA